MTPRADVAPAPHRVAGCPLDLFRVTVQHAVARCTFVPDTGDVLDLAAANFTTVIGALCFLAGAVGMVVEDRRARIPAARVPTASASSPSSWPVCS